MARIQVQQGVAQRLPRRGRDRGLVPAQRAPADESIAPIDTLPKNTESNVSCL